MTTYLLSYGSDLKIRPSVAFPEGFFLRKRIQRRIQGVFNGFGRVSEAPLESHLRKGKCIEGLGENLYFLLTRWLLGRFPLRSHLPSCNLFCVAKMINRVEG